MTELSRFVLSEDVPTKGNPMRVQVDRDRCLSTALCTGLAPEVLDMDETGLLVILDETPSDALRADVLEAVRACPLQALTVSES